MKIVKCCLLASLASAAALNSSLTPSALAVTEPNKGSTNTKLGLEQWPPAPWIIPIRGSLTLFIHSYGSGPPAYLTKNSILDALQRFMDRILTRGHPTDYCPPTILQYEGVNLFLIRSREQEAMLLTRSQAASVIQNVYIRTRDSGGREITDAEITDDGVVVRSFELRFQEHPAGMIDTS